MRTILTGLALGALCACGDGTPVEVEAPALHEHEAPHGGALVVLGDELAHVEVLLDDQSGELRAWVLDGEAAAPLRVAQPELVLRVHPGRDDAFEVRLGAIASELTGETAGDTSEFGGASGMLVGEDSFAAELTAIGVLGQDFADVAFRYPEGNE